MKIQVYELLEKYPHPNLKRIRITNGKIEEKYVNGVTLDDIGLVSNEDAVNILLQIFAAIKHLHHLTIIHCDIKPQNIIVDCDTIHVTLIDYDISIIKNKAYENATIKGTEGYMPPEQYEGRYSFANDIYSLCTTIEQTFPVSAYPQFETIIYEGKHFDERRRYQNVEEIEAALFEGRANINNNTSKENYDANDLQEKMKNVKGIIILLILVSIFAVYTTIKIHNGDSDIANAIRNDSTEDKSSNTVAEDSSKADVDYEVFDGKKIHNIEGIHEYETQISDFDISKVYYTPSDELITNEFTTREEVEKAGGIADQDLVFYIESDYHNEQYVYIGNDYEEEKVIIIYGAYKLICDPVTGEKEITINGVSLENEGMSEIDVYTRMYQALDNQYLDRLIEYDIVEGVTSEDN